MILHFESKPRIWNPEFSIAQQISCAEYFAGCARATEALSQKGFWCHAHDIKHHRSMDWNGHGFLSRPFVFCLYVFNWPNVLFNSDERRLGLWTMLNLNPTGARSYIHNAIDSLLCLRYHPIWLADCKGLSYMLPYVLRGRGSTAAQA